MPGNFRVDALRNNSLGGRIIGSIFSLVFLGAGLAGLILMGQEALRIIHSRSWPAVPCVIEFSAITNRTSGYEIHIRYHYRIAGKTWHSEQLKLHSSTSTDYAALQKQIDAYPAGAASQCFVNPIDPSQAILQSDVLWILPFMLIPLHFAAVGASFIFSLWRGPSAAPIQPTPVPAAKTSTRFLRIFFAIFAIAGALAFYFLVVRVALDVMAARNWSATPCIVQSSTVRSHSNNKGSTYSIDILYRYIVSGRAYLSNHYDFLGGSSSGYDGKEAIVQQFPPGTRAVCFVNPNDPTDVVLDRGFSNDVWFGLIPLVFFIIGIAGLIWTVRRPTTFANLDSLIAPKLS